MGRFDCENAMQKMWIIVNNSKENKTNASQGFPFVAKLTINALVKLQITERFSQQLSIKN